MSFPRPTNPPSTWVNQDIVLYHGTSKSNALNIQTIGVDLSYAKPRRDFGKGFYTTTILSQAATWATREKRQSTDPQAEAAILQYTVSRNDLAQLDTLWFTNSKPDDYWSFIFYCRQGNHGHARNKNMIYYDIVIGEVTIVWEEFGILKDADQISFHTDESIQLLNNPTILDV